MLVSRATIKRTTPGQDDVGGQSAVAATVAESVPCRVSALKGDRAAEGGRERIVATHRIYFRNGQDVRELDVVTVSGLEFLVGFVNPVNFAGGHIEADATVRKG